MFRTFLLSTILMLLTGCYNTYQPLEARNSTLTQGNVQLNLKVGRTTKADVLDKFGAPNITTRNGSGKEVWTYQRAGQVSQSESSIKGLNVIFIGSSRSNTGFESSSRMITLIIEFNENDIVTDFRSRSSNF